MLLINNKKFIILFLVFFFSFLPTYSLDEFDFNLLNERLNRIEAELADIQKSLYAGSSDENTESSKKGPISSRHEIRINKLENDFRKVTGQFEEIFFRLNQLQEKLDKLDSDINFRLSNTGNNQSIEKRSTPETDTYAYPSNKSQIDASGGDTEILGTLKDSNKEIDNMEFAKNFQTPESLYEYGKTALLNLNYEDAENAFKGFIEKYPKDNLVPEAYFWAGESLFVRQKYDESIFMYGQVIKKYKKNKKAPDSLLKIGISLENLNKTKQACDALKKINKLYPDSDKSILKKANYEIQQMGC